MKEAVRSKELKTAKYRIGDTKADLKIAVSELCLPVVVKTPRGCGSNLVEICRLVEENRPIPITKDSWSNPFFCLLSHRDPKIIETDTAKIRKLFRLEIGGN
jgi:carbamoylphosphate synthase large subunit